MRQQDRQAHRGHTYEDQAEAGEFDALGFCYTCNNELTDDDNGCPPQTCRRCHDETEP